MGHVHTQVPGTELVSPFHAARCVTDLNVALERVKVDLGKVFEKGQAYVALSRATSLDGLQVLNFNASKVMAHRKVAVWSERLRDLNT